MTIANQTNKTRQHGNGITDTFNFSFPIFQSSNLEVYKIDITTTPETETKLTETTDYTVEISQTTEGGSVTFVVTPTSDEDVFIKRVLPYTQKTEIPINGNFPETNVENELDKSRMIDIQNQEETDRTLKVNEFYDGSADFEIANPEAGKVIGWDATGLIMVNYSGSDLDTILTTSYGQQLVQSANALGARNLLELGTSDDVEFNDLTVNDTIANNISMNDLIVNSIALTEGALNLQGKYWIWGFVPSSSSGDPDEDIDITVGKAICEDGSTIIELTSAETDLSLPTLNGGALGNDTTYHLFRYLKDDDTMQWHLDTSLTPTISDINSALAYRRICSFKTDGSGDLYAFHGYKLSGGAVWIKLDEGINEGSGIESATKALLTLSAIPLGLNLECEFSISRSSSGGSLDAYLIFSPDIDPTVDKYNQDIFDGIGTSLYENGARTNFKITNTSSQIAHKGDTAGNINIGFNSFIDRRNYF